MRAKILFFLSFAFFQISFAQSEKGPGNGDAKNLKKIITDSNEYNMKRQDTLHNTIISECESSCKQVVRVYVNRKGIVTNTIGNRPGTVAPSMCCKQRAEMIARKFRYNPDPKAPENRIILETIILKK